MPYRFPKFTNYPCKRQSHVQTPSLARCTQKKHLHRYLIHSVSGDAFVWLIPYMLYAKCATSLQHILYNIHFTYIILLLYVESLDSRIYCAVAKLFFDSKELVVLCNSLWSRRSACLDLACIECYCEICDSCICCLT